MLSVVTWKWKPDYRNYRSKFGPETVNTLFRMVKRHYHNEYRAICVTDDPAGIDPSIEIVPLWNDFKYLPNPFGPRNPSCYRRLRMFAPDIAETFGPRFVSIDLDTVITGDVTPLWDRPEDFVAYGDTNRTTHYNGSLMLLTAGARTKVWETFDPKTSPKQAKQAGCYGSDQAWISYCLGPTEAKWSRDDGVYSFRNDIQAKHAPLPSNARMVMFHGKHDPWQAPVQKLYPWIQEHYR